MEKEQRSLIVGFDICNDYSQISCYDQKTCEPESIYIANGSGSCLIPTVLYMKTEKEWFYGEEAINLAKENEGILVENIIKRIEENEPIEVMGTVISGTDLLVKFLRKSLSLLKAYYPSNTILKLMFTTQNLNINLINAIYEASKELGIFKDRVSVQTHEESAIYYIFSQNKEIWINDVGLFDFNDEGVTYYQISSQRKTVPYTTYINKKKFPANLDYCQTLEEENYESLDRQFEEIAREALDKQILTSIFLTGKGFAKDWGDNTLKFLCMNRRVFKGQNLYTKGACYSAYEHIIGNSKFKEYVFLGEGKIECAVEVRADIKSKESNITLVRAGEFWYDANCTMDFIIKEGNSVEVLIKNIVTQDTIREIITLDGLAERPKRTTRISLNTKFIDKSTCIITIRDKGFGDIYPSTNRVWEKIIEI